MVMMDAERARKLSAVHAQSRPTLANLSWTFLFSGMELSSDDDIAIEKPKCKRYKAGYGDILERTAEDGILRESVTILQVTFENIKTFENEQSTKKNWIDYYRKKTQQKDTADNGKAPKKISNYHCVTQNYQKTQKTRKKLILLL